MSGPPSTPSVKTPIKVVCTCTACAKLFFINQQGEQQPGREVASSTRTLHRKKDRLALAEHSTPAVEPEHDQATPDQVDVSLADGVVEAEVEIIRRGRAFDPRDLVENGDDNRKTFRQSLYVLVCTLAVWLHLKCGLSRTATNQTLKVLGFIVVMAINFGHLLAHSNPYHDYQPVSKPDPPRLPHDVHTAMNALSLEPVILRSICCPKCFAKYSLASLPQICSRRETPRSRPCGESLWTIRSTRGGPKHVPRRLYSTQDFESWLEFFLSRPGIEDLIDKSYSHPASTNVMHCIWDSPAWHSLGSFTTTPGNLTFSYYIDWFNPLLNKTAGKTMSVGAIMLFCLNLPYEQQHLVENTFFAGITPPPKEPTITTITAVSDPIIDRLDIMYNGKIIRTNRCPEGKHTRVAVLPFIGDLMAIRKAGGFAGIRSHNFCSFCTLRHADMDNLDPSSWTLRVGSDVRLAAEAWQAAQTKVRRKEIFDQHGVRWSALHKLRYRDPVRHTVLGVMHNWIEGVLQHQARVKYGIGIVAGSKTDAEDNEHNNPTLPATPMAGQQLDIDIDMLDGELAALHAESQEFPDTPSHRKRLHSESSLQLSDEAVDDSPDDEFQPDEESDSDSDYADEEKEEREAAWRAICIFDPAALSKIHACISGTVVPTWIDRPPSNLGEKSHGKLKADQWLTLFTIFLPLILPEIWLTSRTTRNAALLDNFHDLVKCTNIVCSYSASNASSDDYLYHYIRYRGSSKKLFPRVSTRPNHHYAMHNRDLMMFWGPLPMISEFPYEQHNGTLQKIKTNSHIWEMDLTMLRQICRRGRLTGFIQDCISTQSPFSAALMVMFPNVMTPQSEMSTVSSHSEAQHNSRGQKLPSVEYNLILDYIHALRPNCLARHYKDLPHPEDAVILPPVAVPVTHITHKGRSYSTFSMHSGNSSISYHRADGTVDAGFITSMWKQILYGESHLFIIVSPHSQLSADDASQSPYTSRPGFLGTLVYSQPPLSQKQKQVLIQQTQIKAHMANYTRPPGTFGIKAETMILMDSLHRNRE